MIGGTAMSFSQGLKPIFPLHLGSRTIGAYIGVEALVFNLVVTGALSVLLDRQGVPRGRDVTQAADFHDAAEEPVPTTLLGSTSSTAL